MNSSLTLMLNENERRGWAEKFHEKNEEEKSVVKSNKPLINLLSIFLSLSLFSSLPTCLHSCSDSLDRRTPVHVCMIIETSWEKKTPFVGHSPQSNFSLLTFSQSLFFNALPRFSISLVPLFRIYIKMKQENVIVWENNKKNDKDNILSKRSWSRNEQRQSDMNYLLSCKNVKNMLLPFLAFASHYSRLLFQPLVTRLENIKYVVIEKENVLLWRATWKRGGE